MEFKGEFETHLTVELNSTQILAELQSWSAAAGLKFLHIVLDQGAVPSQPMFSERSAGTLRSALIKAVTYQNLLAEQGYKVSRIKIEAAPGNEEVPHSKFEALKHSEKYFEHHLKLILSEHSDIRQLTEIAEAHHAHLSRNALRKNVDGFEERFITQRCFSAGFSEAQEDLAELIEEITRAGCTILETESEYVVYDSNLDLDRGWIKSTE